MRKLLRLPIVDKTDSRVSAANPLPASSGVVGIGIVGIMIVGQTVDPSAKDARHINCFKRSVGDDTYCWKRSGMAFSMTVQVSSTGVALMVWTGQGNGDTLITAFGSVSSSIYQTSTLIGTNNSVTTNIGAKATGITETTINNAPVLYITASNNSGWFYDTTISTVIVKISDAQYPGNVTSLTLAGTGAHLDGYTFQMDTAGGIWNSDLNTISSWTATGVINANLYPDKGVGCIRWRQYIIGFGQETIEFFYNTGNAQGSPLTRIPNMAQRIGAVHADAVVSISDAVFFCGSTSQGGLAVYMYDGQVSRISPPEIDAVLLLAGASNIKMTTLLDLGLHFVLVKAGTSQYAYLIEEKFWFIWQSNLGFVRFAGLSTGSPQVVYGVSELITDGKVYTINPVSRSFQDDGQVYSAKVQTKPIEPGNGAFTSYEEAQIVADVELSTSILDLSWSDDDYATNSNTRTLNLSTNVPKTSRLGGTKNPRSFSLTHADNTPMRIKELRVRVNVGR